MFFKTMKTATIMASAIIPAAAHSDAPMQDRMSMAAVALGSGSERMAIYALSDPDMPLPVRVQAGKISNDRGFGPNAGFEKVQQEVNFQPILSYDSDINGGIGKSGFSAGGIDFVIPEGSRRKSGIVIGAEFDASARYSLGRQTVLDMSAWGSYAWSPKHEISKISAGASGCVVKQFERDLYGSACLAYGMFRTDLKDDESLVAELSVNKLFGGNGGPVHDISLGVSKAHVRDNNGGGSYEQARVRVGGDTLLRNGDLINYRATFGEKVDGEKVRTFGASAAYAKNVNGTTIIAGLGYNDYAGARWLGSDVREESFSASLRAVTQKGVDFGVEYVKTSSGSQINDGDEVFFSIKYEF